MRINQLVKKRLDQMDDSWSLRRSIADDLADLYQDNQIRFSQIPTQFRNRRIYRLAFQRQDVYVEQMPSKYIQPEDYLVEATRILHHKIK